MLSVLWIILLAFQFMFKCGLSGDGGKSIVTIHTCLSQAQEKNCELFQTWRFGRETCTMLVQRHALWSPLYGAFEPQLKCPILKGQYNIVNATVDPTMLINLFGASLLEKHFWRVRINVYDYKLFAGTCFGLAFIHGKH